MIHTPIYLHYCVSFFVNNCYFARFTSLLLLKSTLNILSYYCHMGTSKEESTCIHYNQKMLSYAIIIAGINAGIQICKMLASYYINLRPITEFCALSRNSNCHFLPYYTLCPLIYKFIYAYKVNMYRQKDISYVDKTLAWKEEVPCFQNYPSRGL